MDLKTIILTILFVVSGVFYYIWTAPDTQIITTKIIEVTDGDTVVIESEEKVRLKGINTPERGQPYYNEAKEFLESKISNKTVQVKSYKKDKYNRTLGYIYFNNQNINSKILEEGLATLYYYEKDSEYNELSEAEEYARFNQLNLWKTSKDSNCLELIELKFKETPTRCTNSEVLTIKNNCDKEFNVIIKDDANHIYKENILSNSVFTRNFSCIFNDNGDSLYVRDQEYLLMFYRY